MRWWSNFPLKEHILSAESYVWPYGKGSVRGHGVLSLYPSVPEAENKDEKLYELLALSDALHVERARAKRVGHS